jgi:hypothetical protein
METQQVVMRSDLQGNEKPRFNIDRGMICNMGCEHLVIC